MSPKRVMKRIITKTLFCLNGIVLNLAGQLPEKLPKAGAIIDAPYAHTLHEIPQTTKLLGLARLMFTARLLTESKHIVFGDHALFEGDEMTNIFALRTKPPLLPLPVHKPDSSERERNGYYISHRRRKIMYYNCNTITSYASRTKHSTADTNRTPDEAVSLGGIEPPTSSFGGKRSIR